MTFLSQAHYRGTCPTCGAPIDIGDWLQYRDAGMTCRLCPDEAGIPEPREAGK